MRDTTSSEAASVRIKQPFRIPIIQWHVEGADDLNAQLADTILARYEMTDGIQVSNRDGGWHSKKTLQDWSAPGIDQLMQHIGDGVRDIVQHTVDEPQPTHFDRWLIEAWANVNVKGARNESHAHGGRVRPTLWSGIYYVDPGRTTDDGSAGGRTVFEDRIGVPRLMDASGTATPQEMTIEPQAGMMVMFPSTLHHRVEPYLGDTRRITIAWNLYHPLFRVPQYEEPSDKPRTVRGSRALWHAVQLLKTGKGVVRSPFTALRKLVGSSPSPNQRPPAGDRAEVPPMDGLKGRTVSRLQVQDASGM